MFVKCPVEKYIFHLPELCLKNWKNVIWCDLYKLLNMLFIFFENRKSADTGMWTKTCLSRYVDTSMQL